MNKVEKETNEIIKLINLKEELLHLIMSNKGEIVFNKPLFINSWNIKKIKAVYFTEQIDIITCGENGWNEYVGRVRNAIGVECYLEWIKNLDGKMVGLIAFFNSKNEEIKVKHFKKWSELMTKIKAKNIMEDSEVLSETFDKFKELLDAKKYEEVNSLMETYLNDDTKSPGDLKTVLVITSHSKQMNTSA